MIFPGPRQRKLRFKKVTVVLYFSNPRGWIHNFTILCSGKLRYPAQGLLYIIFALCPCLLLIRSLSLALLVGLLRFPNGDSVLVFPPVWGALRLFLLQTPSSTRPSRFLAPNLYLEVSLLSWSVIKRHQGRSCVEPYTGTKRTQKLPAFGLSFPDVALRGINKGWKHSPVKVSLYMSKTRREKTTVSTSPEVPSNWSRSIVPRC